MGIFDFKGYTSKEATDLVYVGSKLAIYTNASYFMRFPGASILNWIGNKTGSMKANKYDISIPNEWREIEPTELGLPITSKDRYGYYTFESPVWGKAPISGTGPQAKIFGKFENNKLTKVSLSYCGTNDLWDIADYFHINSGKVIQPAEPLLDVVKSYVIENGLSSKDVIITGYSLGGALTNVMAKYRESLSDGFFAEADYLGFSSPYIYEDKNVIFNMGYENDAVYRILGNESSFADSYHAANSGFVNPDKNFDSSADNVVIFGKGISSPLWSYKLLSIFNRLGGWAAHGEGAKSDAIERIINSKFYEHMDIDSTIIIDQLSIFKRWSTWVKDKISAQHQDYGRPAFIIGNEYNNLLQGSYGGDYIEGNGGNDRIKPGSGADRVDGGTGIDSLVLAGKAAQWNAYHLSDGTLFMSAKDKSGLVQAENIEKIEFQGQIMTYHRPYDVTDSGLYDNYHLIKRWKKNITYNEHTEGSNEDDLLQGAVVFGKTGDDFLFSLEKGSLLHGGEGSDVLVGNKGDDQLYGAEGNDVIKMTQGNDIVYGGLGNDVFVFDQKTNFTTIIKDFNAYSGEQDKVLFSSELFSSSENVLHLMKQQDRNVTLEYDNVSIVFENNSLSDFNTSNIGIV